MNGQRRYDLDWLRVIAFGLLMLFHTGMMFSTWDWHVKNIQTSDTFNLVMRWLHTWRMPLLFFISGSAVWFAMDRLATWRFLLERQKRLLLPLVFGMLVVIPPQVYLERLYHQQSYASFWDFYKTLFTLGPYPEGNLSWHHLWYIPYIWTYSMLMLPLFVALKTQAGRRGLNCALAFLSRPFLLFLFFLPSALIEIWLRPHWPSDAHDLFGDWANFTHKLTFFVAGFCLASGTGLYDLLAKHRRKFLIAALVAYPLLHLVWNGALRMPPLGYRLLSNFHVWMWLLAVLGYGRAYLSFNLPFLRAANDAVYPFYILHQTVIISFAYRLAYVNWGIGLKFLFVAAGTFLVCWAIYALAIRPFNLLRVCFGMKWRTPAGEPTRTKAVPGTPAGRLVGLVRSSAIAVVLGCLVLLTSCGRNRGELLCRTMVAPSLSNNVMGVISRQQLVIYLPPSYRKTQRHFPVLYFLPNFKGDLWRYTGGDFQGFRFEQAMARQLATAQSREMIIVIPNTVHFLGNSWYRNSPLTGNWEDYVVTDVVGYVDRNFRTIPSAEARALAGHGVGGLGALELGMKHPDTFSAVYAMSPAVLDAKGLVSLGPVVERTVVDFRRQATSWEKLADLERRRHFRDFIQTRLNSPNRDRFFQGLLLSYAAAVAPELHAPYPHISLEKTSELDRGMGGWPEKLTAYLKQPQRLRSITIEYGQSEEYEWIRHGADALAALMNELGIPTEKTVPDGGHEYTLGRRMETGMLPAISRALNSK